jgi:CRP/FNR family transcriptional regulator, cyclic AMP receptor protein
MINPFKKSYSIKELNLFRMLSKIKPFERLNYEEMALFLPHLYLREYKLDEAVFFRNDPSNAFYIVKSGKVTLNIDINKTFEVLQVLKSGGFFGHNAFLEHSIRVYSAIVISETCELYVLPKVNIMEIFDRRAKIRAKMMTSIAELYNDFNHQIFNTYRSSLGFFNLSDAYLK